MFSLDMNFLYAGVGSNFQNGSPKNVSLEAQNRSLTASASLAARGLTSFSRNPNLLPRIKVQVPKKLCWIIKEKKIIVWGGENEVLLSKPIRQASSSKPRTNPFGPSLECITNRLKSSATTVSSGRNLCMVLEEVSSGVRRLLRRCQVSPCLQITPHLMSFKKEGQPVTSSRTHYC